MIITKTTKGDYTAYYKQYKATGYTAVEAIINLLAIYNIKFI